MLKSVRSPLFAIVGALAVCAAAAGPTQAREGRHAAAAAGAIGGLAAGAILGGAMSNSRGYGYEAPVYGSPAPVYGDEAYDEGPVCHVERRRVWVEGRGWRMRRTEICD